MVAPVAGVLVGKFIRREAQGYPKLCLVKAASLERKLETARHDPDDRVRPAVENDVAADNVGIAVEVVQPQGVTDDGQRLMVVLFLRGEHAAEDGLNTERGENAASQAGSGDFLSGSAARKLKVSADVATKGGKGLGGARVYADFTRSHGSPRATSQVISQLDESIGILEWKRPQQDAFDERVNRGGGADAQDQREHDG